MGRPRKETTDKRSEQVNVRFTPQEMQTLLTAAAHAGLPLVTLLRNRALKARIPTATIRRLDPETVDQLRRIGVNLNQAMRLANATRTIPPELASAAAAVEDFLTREIAGHGP